MNKLYIFLVVIMVSVLVACNDNNQSLGQNNSNNIVENENNEKESPKVQPDQGELDEQQENHQGKKELQAGIGETLEPEYSINTETWSIDPIKDANEKVALLTIDDAPDKYALQMAKTLKDLDANAIFFVNGHLLETEDKREMLKEIYEMGFVIGNHTYHHANLKDLSKKEQKEEIVHVNDMVEEIIGERPKFFRAPFGVYTDYAKEIIKDEKMVRMNWTYGYDYFDPYKNKESLVEAMVTGEGPEVGVDYSLLKPGANLLMHDREWTASGIHDIVTGLRDKGYEMVDPKLISTKDFE